MPVLTRWGLSARADLVFRALLVLGARSAPELASSLQMPGRQVLAAIDELSAAGAVQPLREGDSPQARVWRAGEPDTVVGSLRERQAAVARARQRLPRHLSTVDILGTAAADLRVARPILGVPAVRARLADLVLAERHEHLAMNPEPAFTATSAKAGIPVSRAALQRGVTTWTLGVPAEVADQSEVHTQELYTYGLRYRELAQQPIKLMIMDRTTAFFPLDPGANFSRGVWEITCPSVVDQLVAFFLRHWSVAIEPATAAWRPPTTLTTRERAILALLAAGATDATVALTLRLSVRTIAYTIKDLMERYRVQTRFQLGLVLGTGTQAPRTGNQTTDGGA